MRKMIFWNKLLLGVTMLFTTISVSALEVGISHASFNSVNNTKYVEIYFQVIAQTVNLKTFEDSTYQASVDFTLLIKNQQGEIVSFDKFNLNSKRSKIVEDFISVRRISIGNGNYTLEIEAKDVNAPTNIYKYKNDLNVDLKNDEMCFSNIQLLAKIEKNNNTSNPFVKNGYYLEPVLSYFVPEKVENLGIYMEAYNTNLSEEDKNIRLSIIKGFYGDKGNVIFRKKLNVKNRNISPVLTRIGIKSLNSGNYHLLAELVNKKGDVLFSRYVNFQRSNPKSDIFVSKQSTIDNYENSYASKLTIDSIIYTLKAMLPILNADKSTAANNIIASKDKKQGRYLIWNYWSDKAGEHGYKEYMKYANIVDTKFRSQVGYGFETDRGYIYLKYGMPSQIFTNENEPSAPPYEFWFYDQIEQGKQTNIKFIFYMPSLANNDYVLLHSNCRGEKNDPIWFYRLYSKRNDSNIRHVRTDQVKDFYNKLKNSFNNNAVILWEEMK